MTRYELRDDQWDRIKERLPGRRGHVGVTAKDNRRFVEAVLYCYRAGIPRRDLPERFGDWKNSHRRFSRWAKTGVWMNNRAENSRQVARRREREMRHFKSAASTQRSCCMAGRPGYGRPGLLRPARGDPATRPRGAGLRQSSRPPPRRRGHGRAGEEPNQVAGAGPEPALAKAGVEHAIGVVKRVFGFAKVRYRGLKKTAHRLIVTCALANLFIVRRRSDCNIRRRSVARLRKRPSTDQKRGPTMGPQARPTADQNCLHAPGRATAPFSDGVSRRFRR